MKCTPGIAVSAAAYALSTGVLSAQGLRGEPPDFTVSEAYLQQLADQGIVVTMQIHRSVWAFGNNWQDQLGVGTTHASDLSIAVPGPEIGKVERRFRALGSSSTRVWERGKLLPAPQPILRHRRHSVPGFAESTTRSGAHR
jgi:hypothetical protein